MKYKTLKIEADVYEHLKKYCKHHNYKISAWASESLFMETMDLPEQLEYQAKKEKLKKLGGTPNWLLLSNEK